MSDAVSQSTPITIQLNGQPRELPAAMTVAELLSHLGLPATGVAVALNGSFVPRGQRAQVRLAAGDQIECVAPMQGG